MRRVAAREGIRPPRDTLGRWFEQWVGLELIRRARLAGRPCRIRFWRDPDGPEVDWVIDLGGKFIPVEVKWTDTPSNRDIRYLNVFMAEHPTAKKAYVVCRVPRRMSLAPHIDAIPWQRLDSLIAPAREL